MHTPLSTSEIDLLERAAALRRRRKFLSICAAALCGTWGCRDFNLRLQSPEEERRDNARAALSGEEGHSRMIGDYIHVTGLHAVPLEGVGLITNLDNTGDDPPATPFRTDILDDMRRRGIREPNRVLADPTTTVVQVRAYLPPLIRKGERFDVEVRVPDGGEAASLRGGTLLECQLSEQAFVPNRGPIKGHRLAIAHGQVLVGGDEDDPASDTLQRGVIPGGAVYAGADRNLAIHLRHEYRNARMADTIARRIGQRFHDYDQYGIKKPLAEAVSDAKIDLIVHSRYRDNYPRYLQCIRHLMLRDSTIDRQLRLQQLKDQLQSGPTAARAAIELEGIGVDAVPVLQSGLKAKHLESRFYAAEALAYLGNSDGADVLRDAAAEEPAFRVFSLAALSALGSSEAVAALESLLNHASLETRYGAVRALSTIAADNPAVEAERMPGDFLLRVVDCQGEPMVHVTRRKKSEIVVFGADQVFRAPMVASAGKEFLVKAEPGRSTVTVSRIVPGQDVQRQQVPARVADVVRALGRMQARYPDIVQLLIEAERQHNLPGPIGIDELPRAGRTYLRPAEGLAAASSGAEVQVGQEAQAPNIFGGEQARPSAGSEPERLEETAHAGERAAPEGAVDFVVQ